MASLFNETLDGAILVVGVVGSGEGVEVGE
jgi:hypothetical protein